MLVRDGSPTVRKTMLGPYWRGYRPLRPSNMLSVYSRQTAIVAIAIVAIFVWIWHFHRLPVAGPSQSLTKGRTPQPRYHTTSGKGFFEGIANFEKPKGLDRIVGLVFYGRPASVSILDCYLKRNLIKYGGMLDEVIFIARTTRDEDLAWLDVLISQESAYSRLNVTFNGKDYRSSYDDIKNGTMYIKIDDDIVFIEDTTIPTLVYSKLDHPEHYVVSANIMNQPSLSWVHYHLGAVRPYLPEVRPPPPTTDERMPNQRTSWRASELPAWKGPEDFDISEFKSLYPKHRWLPLKPESGWNIDDTPIIQTSYDAFSKGLWNWTIAAQEHYSFFENLENNELYRYKFQQWDYNYTRMGIQFVAMMGEDINMAKPIDVEDDEYYFSQVIPDKTGRHAIVDGRALVAHYSFEPQRVGIATTDILDRYRAYAKENICP